ncbi:MAG: YHYH domain-containing protein [Acidobacteriota bacterium]
MSRVDTTGPEAVARRGARVAGLVVILAGWVVVLSAPPPATAHPGRTDSSGCHTCRTNCRSWGLRTGQYHCHGGRSSARSSRRASPPPPPAPPPEPVRVLPQPPGAVGRPPENTIVLRGETSTSLSHRPARVVTVVDGDTFVVRQGGELFLVRLHHADAPELEQPFGAEARDRLATRIAGRQIGIRPYKDGIRGNVVPVQVDVAGRDVAQELLAEGFAWARPKAAANWHRLEAVARRAEVGLWSGSRPEPPWQFRGRLPAP